MKLFRISPIPFTDKYPCKPTRTQAPCWWNIFTLLFSAIFPGLERMPLYYVVCGISDYSLDEWILPAAFPSRLLMLIVLHMPYSYLLPFILCYSPAHLEIPSFNINHLCGIPSTLFSNTYTKFSSPNILCIHELSYLNILLYILLYIFRYCFACPPIFKC